MADQFMWEIVIYDGYNKIDDIIIRNICISGRTLKSSNIAKSVSVCVFVLFCFLN